jgi:hypothetical protein
VVKIDVESPFNDPLTILIANFLAEIGIGIERATISQDTFLPGILVKNGRLLVDEDKLAHPGDLLHEAGHLAVSPSDVRLTLSDEVALPDEVMEGIEAFSIAWSYAAALHLGIDPRLVFHPEGYLGRSEALLTTYELGVYIGANGLEEYGMTANKGQVRELGLAPYPHVMKWLRD